MKYTVTGALGHISKPLTEILVTAGHDVTVITSSADRKAAIEALGAKAAVGSVEDTQFLTQAFTGADALYTMIPPNMAAADWKEYIHSIGRNYAAAIKAAGVKKVVSLSSIGAHMPEGCGPVSGLNRAESELNKLEGVDIKYLRPGFFYINFYGNMGMIKHMGIIGGNYGDGTSLVMSHPNDIAVAAAEELQQLNFTGHSVRYVVSDEQPTGGVAQILGAAIGKPELPWVNFKDEDALKGMTGAGMPQEVAANFVEMGSAVASGQMFSEYNRDKPGITGKIKLEEFAKEFAAAYAHA